MTKQKPDLSQLKKETLITDNTGLCWDRSGEDYKNNCSVEGSQENLASIVPNAWSLKQSGLLLAKLSNRRRRVLVREVIKTLLVTLFELHDLIWRWEKLIEGQTSLRHSTNLGLMAKWPNSSFSSVKIHETRVVTVPKFQYSVPIPVKIHGSRYQFRYQSKTQKYAN